MRLSAHAGFLVGLVIVLLIVSTPTAINASEIKELIETSWKNCPGITPEAIRARAFLREFASKLDSLGYPQTASEFDKEISSKCSLIHAATLPPGPSFVPTFVIGIQMEAQDFVKNYADSLGIQLQVKSIPNFDRGAFLERLSQTERVEGHIIGIDIDGGKLLLESSSGVISTPQIDKWTNMEQLGVLKTGDFIHVEVGPSLGSEARQNFIRDISVQSGGVR